MKNFYVYLADIYGDNIEIEKGILQDIAEVKQSKREEDEEKEKVRVITEAKNADAIGVRHTRMSREIIDKLDRCRIIARFGIGVEHIDIEAATEKGIIITFVPDYCTEAVAEHALAFALMKIRGLRQFEDRIKQGFWSAQRVTTEMAQDVALGIVGLGRIGGALSRKASSVGFKVIAYDPLIPDEDFSSNQAKKMAELSDLLKSADIISLNVPLTKKEESKYPTFRMIGREELEKTKDGAYLINTCRGEVVDNEALVAALKSGKISGLATDVVEGEPVQNSYLKEGDNPTFDRLREIPSVTITPHCAFSSTRSVLTVKEKGALEIKRVLEGRFPRDIAWVNPEVKSKYLERFG